MWTVPTLGDQIVDYKKFIEILQLLNEKGMIEYQHLLPLIDKGMKGTDQ